MTKFTNEPYQKIIVKNLVQDNLENLIAQCDYHRQKGVFWVNGMIISIPKLIYAGEPEYENMVKGIQYFTKVVFVKFPKYTSTITQKNCVDCVRLLNYSNNNKFKELAKWIKSQTIWNETLEEQE